MFSIVNPLEAWAKRELLESLSDGISTHLRQLEDREYSQIIFQSKILIRYHPLVGLRGAVVEPLKTLKVSSPLDLTQAYCKRHLQQSI